MDVKLIEQIGKTKNEGAKLTKINVRSVGLTWFQSVLYKKKKIVLNSSFFKNACCYVITNFNLIIFLFQPPTGNDRAAELGTWQEREVKVSGTSWDVNTIDIAIAGLGWFSLCLKGEATTKLWVFHGVEVTLREPLVLDRAPSLEKPGFWLPKAISDAIGNQTKLEAQRRKQQLEDEGTEYVGAGAELSA